MHGFDDYYFMTEDIDISKLTLQKEEVQAAKWASREEIKRMLDSGEFIPYYESLIDFMFDSKDYYGAHVNEPQKFIK